MGIPRKPQRTGAASIAVLVALLLASCGGEADEGAASDSASGDYEATVEDLGGEELVQSAKDEGAVTVYTALNTNEAQVVSEAFQDRFPEIEVEIVTRPGGELQELIISESNAGRLRADVVEQSDPALMLDLDERGLIGTFTPPSSDSYAKEAVLNEKIYPPYVQLHSFAYNTSAVPEEDAPETWDDFLDEQFDGRRTTPAPAAGGCAWALSMFQRSVLGLDYWKQLAEAGPAIINSNTQMIELLARGENLVTTMLDPVASTFIEDGAPVEMVYPSEGVAPCRYAAGVVAESPNPNAGELWLNWLLSVDGQSVWVEELNGVSEHEEMPLPEDLPDDVKVWDLPMDEYFSLRDEWIAEWNDIFDYRL